MDHLLFIGFVSIQQMVLLLTERQFINFWSIIHRFQFETILSQEFGAQSTQTLKIYINSNLWPLKNYWIIPISHSTKEPTLAGFGNALLKQLQIK